jgi:ABC-type bacteriocin/lantibiotic exporter with double-glycine peptidase domain
MLVVSVGFTSAFAVATLRVERRRQAVEGEVAGLVFEIIGGLAKLRVAGAERRAFAVWTRRFREERDLAFRVGVYENFVAVFNDVLPLVGMLALLGTTGYLITRGTALNTGDFVAFNAAFGSFFASGIMLSDTLIHSLNLVPLMERARPILQSRLETAAARPDPGELTGRIEVSHVSFRYKGDGPPILRDVSVHAAPGEFVALVGPSGSGKSTLLRLLLGFEAPEAGAIYFDGHNLGLVDLTGVRSQMGVVLQSSRLLAGDIFENIIGTAPLTVADAWSAAEMAGLADDIRAMPMGMQTVVSEGGSTLSGGQRQRVLIARALVRRPRIVLFDEATSALDNRTQEIVSRSLENMAATRIVIAHRLSTVRHADRIVVMAAGQIVQQGSYDELASASGLFATMIARQLI